MIRLVPNRRSLAIGVVWAGLASAATLALPILLGRTLTELPAPSGFLVASLVALLVARTGCSYLASSALGALGVTAIVDLRRRLVARFLRASLADHDSSRTGDLLAALTTDAAPAQLWSQSILPAAMIHGPVAIVGGAWLLYLRPTATLLVAALAVPSLFVTYRAGTEIRKLQGQSKGTLGALAALVAEALSDVRWLKMGGAGESVTTEAGQILDRQFEVKRRLVHRIAVSGALVPGLLTGAAAVAILGVFSGAGRDPGQAAMYGSLLLLVTASVVRLTVLWVQAQSMWGGLDRIESLAGRITEEPAPTGRSFEWRELRLEEVCFGYREGQAVLCEVSLTVNASESLMVFGPNGAGKSSLLDVIMGLRVPTRGRFLIDGRSLDAGELPRWRGQFGYVGSEPSVFATTVRANLSIHGQASAQGMSAALETVGLGAWARELPAGLDEQLGERGRRLSRGQRQRLALARLLLQDAPFLVFDEALNSIDPASIARILAAFAKRRRAPTILMAAPVPLVGFEFDQQISLGGEQVESGARFAERAGR